MKTRKDLRQQGLIVYKREYKKDFYHIKVRLVDGEVLDVIWWDNTAKFYDMKSGQYCAVGNYITFDLEKNKAKGKDFFRLTYVAKVNFEHNFNRLYYYTNYQICKRAEADSKNILKKIAEIKKDLEYFVK